MITKASELLELFIKNETEKLENGANMPHMPTLGSAYEEITKQGIDRDFSIPKGLNLKVISGFIRVDGDMLPEQIDCMLVHGVGEQYGLTENFIYEIDQVLCIFEVKKKLKKSNYIDAFEHLGKIRRKFTEHFEKKVKEGNFEPDVSIAKKHFSKITGKTAPENYMGIHSLPKDEAVLFYALVQETLAPISIIQGYEGYTTETGLRSAFINFLEEKREESAQGLGIQSIPSLVVSNQYCLVKGNGVPFLTISEGSWVAVSSTRHNSAKMILEIIWSKIALYFSVKMPWNDGLKMENLQHLIVAKPVEVEKNPFGWGWLYEAINLKEKDLRREDNNSWSPTFLGKAEISAIDIMMIQGGYLPLDKEMKEYLEQHENTTLDKVVENLLNSCEFMMDGKYLRPINKVTSVLTIENETGFVSSEKDKFDLWCDEQKIEPHYKVLIFLENT
jgi:hypothetical protein